MPHCHVSLPFLLLIENRGGEVEGHRGTTDGRNRDGEWRSRSKDLCLKVGSKYARKKTSNVFRQKAK